MRRRKRGAYLNVMLSPRFPCELCQGTATAKLHRHQHFRYRLLHRESIASIVHTNRKNYREYTQNDSYPIVEVVFFCSMSLVGMITTAALVYHFWDIVYSQIRKENVRDIPVHVYSVLH